MQISIAALSEVMEALERYREEVNATTLREPSKQTYLLHAEHFVRWLEGDFKPGSRKP